MVISCVINVWKVIPGESCLIQNFHFINKIYIYMYVCMRVWTQTQFYFSQCNNQCIYKEMTKHSYYDILLNTYISNVNVNTYSCIRNVVLLRNLWEKFFFWDVMSLILSHVLFSSSKYNGILQRLLSQNHFRETTFSFF